MKDELERYRAMVASEVLTAIVWSGEPEDAKHNAIVEVRNADELIKALGYGNSVLPPAK
jgi:hypothetical protein